VPRTTPVTGGPVARARPPGPDWLSLGPASRMLGVDPDTLRRWADEGRIDVYTTPGGHRRFERRAIDRLASSRRPGRRPLADLGATADRVQRAYRRSYSHPSPHAPSDGVPAADREAYRQDGRRLVEALIAHLDTDPSDPLARARTEEESARHVDDLARRLALSGSSLTEAVTAFVAARRPFLSELAALGRRRALDPPRLAALYVDASGVLDRLLIRFIASFEAGR
jgi:excisionase family DNA binding protein